MQVAAQDDLGLDDGAAGERDGGGAADRGFARDFVAGVLWRGETGINAGDKG